MIWNPTGNGDLVVRGAYAVMVNQTNTGYVGGSASNPPLATPLNVAGAVKLDSAFATAQASGLAPTTTNPNFLPGAHADVERRTSKRRSRGNGVMVGYFGSYGDRLRIPVNINQFVNGVRPFPTLSATSPISPGAALGNITEVAEHGLVALQGPVDHGESADVEGAAVELVVHVVEVDRHELLRRHGSQRQRLASEQLRPRRQRRAVGLRRRGIASA